MWNVLTYESESLQQCQHGGLERKGWSANRSVCISLAFRQLSTTTSILDLPDAAAFMKKKSNVTCFVCNQLGAGSLVTGPDVAVFCCEPCSSVCRQLGFRVRGVSVSNFSDADAEFICELHGNKRGRAYFWAYFDAEVNPPIPIGKPDKLKVISECNRSRLRISSLNWACAVQSPRSSKSRSGTLQTQRTAARL